MCTDSGTECTVLVGLNDQDKSLTAPSAYRSVRFVFVPSRRESAACDPRPRMHPKEWSFECEGDVAALFLRMGVLAAVHLASEQQRTSPRHQNTQQDT